MQRFNIEDKVTYIPKNEKGIIKSIGDDGNIFVVYHCDGKWEEYFNYTAALTREEDLVLGWKMGMSIKEFQERLTSFTEEERVVFIPGLISLLTQVSKNSIFLVQPSWNNAEIFDEYKIRQSNEILSCIKLELMDIGKLVRESEGLKPLSEDDIIPENVRITEEW